MRLSKTWGALAAVLVIGAVACGDDGGPGGGDLDDGQKQALTNALLTADTAFGGIAAFAVNAIGEVGKLNPGTSQSVVRAINEAIRTSVSGMAATEYDGVGLAVDYSITIDGETTQFWFLWVVGWNGLTSNSVSELVMVGGGGFDEPLPSSASGDVGLGEVLAYYLTGGLLHVGVTGQASISGSSFGGASQDCGSASEQGIEYECSYQVGTMDGDFDFEAESGSGTYTQAPVVFAGLPSARLTLNATYTSPGR
jgi:hypothetical protein